MCSPVDGNSNDGCTQVALDLWRDQACGLCFKPQVGNPSPTLALTGAGSVCGMQLKQ